MSSQLSAHAITAHTAMTRISVSRCSTLPAHRGSASAEKCSTSFSTDIAILPSSIKGEPAQPVSPSELARPFHASPLSAAPIKGACEPWSTICCESRAFFQVMNKVEQVAALTPPVLSNFQGQAGWCRNELSTDDSEAVMLG